MKRVAVDMSILRHPPGGTSRYAVEILARLPDALGHGYLVDPVQSSRRVRWRRPLGQAANLTGDMIWWTLGATYASATRGIDAWYSPSNILPLTLPRPMIVTIHDANLLEPDAGYDPAYVLVAAPLFRRSGRRASTVITDSEHARRAIVDRLGIDGARVRVAYPGIDHGSTAEPEARDPALPARYGLVVGRTEPHKNVGLLIRAWHRGISKDLHLLVAGSRGSDHAALERAAAASPARERIHMVGPVSEGRLAQLLRDATCFLFPSRMEGFGLPPLEAMRLGIPTAVANASCLPEVTAGGALTFNPFDPDELAATVMSLLDPATSAFLRRVGPTIAARYTWATTASVIAGAIQEALRDG